MDDRQAQGAVNPDQQQTVGEGVVSAPPRRRLPTQYVATGVVLCVSAATLFAMRRYGMNEGIKYEHATIERVDAQTPIVDNVKYGKVMERLASSSTPLQVSAEHIDKDPFILGSHRADQAPVDDSAERARQAEEAARLAAQRREQDLQNAFSRLSLQSVVIGNVPVAKINNQIVGLNEVVEENFRVVAIDNEGVTLEADGKEYRLLVDSMVNRPGPRGGGGRTPSPTSNAPRRP